MFGLHIPTLVTLTLAFGVFHSIILYSFYFLVIDIGSMSMLSAADYLSSSVDGMAWSVIGYLISAVLLPPVQPLSQEQISSLGVMGRIMRVMVIYVMPLAGVVVIVTAIVQQTYLAIFLGGGLIVPTAMRIVVLNYGLNPSEFEKQALFVAMVLFLHGITSGLHRAQEDRQRAPNVVIYFLKDGTPPKHVVRVKYLERGVLALDFSTKKPTIIPWTDIQLIEPINPEIYGGNV